MNNKIMVTIKRKNGTIDKIDATNKFNCFVNQPLFDGLKKATKAAGRGEVVEAIFTKEEIKSNIKQLIKEYNNLNNEGSFGYLPDDTYFKNMANYKEEIKTTENRFC